MARCEDCIHYGVCIELERYRDPLWFMNTKDEFCCSSYLPADVAPRAEVEELQAELDDFTVASLAECKACGEKTSKVIADYMRGWKND